MQSHTPVDGGGGVLAGGTDGLAPGQSAYLDLDLPAGHYGYLSTKDIKGPNLPGQHGEFDAHVSIRVLEGARAAAGSRPG